MTTAAPPTTRVYRIPSERAKDVVYEVRLFGEKTALCTCPDSRYRRRECKHVLAARWFERLLELNPEHRRAV